MTSEEFEKLTGAPPERDDLERANCDKTGERGHFFCGVMACCGMPRFIGCDCEENKQ